jgi:DNA repair exonuclease SbcCD ATPase subunit
MKINKITLKNFKSIGNSPLEYNFDTQFNLIKGKSGKGKSLLLAGIVWGLFGKSSDFKGSSNSTLPTSKLINDINKKEMLVTIELDNGYTIKRGLSPNIFEVINEKGISVNDLSAKKLDQDMLEQDILKGLTLDVFYTVNYLCDKPSSVPFLYMTKTQRKDYIEKILDLRIVYHLNENLKPYISTNNLELSKLENQKQLLKTTIDNEVFNIQQAQKRIEEQKAKLQDFEVNKNLKIKQQEDIIEKLNSDIGNLKFKIDNLKTDIELKQEDLISIDLMQLQLLQNTYKENEAKIRQIENILVNKQASKDAYESNRNNYVHCQGCPTLDKLTGLFDYDSYNDTLNKSNSAIDMLSKKNVALNNDIHDYNEIVSKNKVVELELQQLNNELQQLNYTLSSNTIELNSNLTLLENIKSSIAPTIQEVNLDYLKKLKLQQDECQVNLDKNYNEKIDLDKMKKIINDKEHKTKALENYLPLFENKLNELLDRFMINYEFGLKCKLLSDFELEFYKNGKVVDIFSLSSGQKSLCNLAVTFAFLYLLEVKHQNGFNMLMVDEILDSSLGIEIMQVIDYLKELSQETNITLISHNTYLIDYPNYDRVVEVEKEGTFTKYIYE